VSFGAGGFEDPTRLGLRQHLGFGSLHPDVPASTFVSTGSNGKKPEATPVDAALADQGGQALSVLK
jgi:hypothetical protein